MIGFAVYRIVIGILGAKVTPHLAGHRRLRFSFFQVA